MDENEDRIRERAYRLWEEEGRPEGREHDHWERARQMLDSERPEQQPQQAERSPAGGESASPVEQPVPGVQGPGPLPGVDDQRQEVKEPIKPRRAEAATAAAEPAPKPPAKGGKKGGGTGRGA
ncbi:MAG: DUF2934 domain-containing protein [Acidisphaera sp.]|nr:DUF2934 domain-containing protein [Acidisphaera sp.]